MSKTEPSCDIAVIGLGVMGANLARNLASRDIPVAIYNRTTRVADELAATHPEAGFTVVHDYQQLIAALVPPRQIVVMVSAGKAVDAVLGDLDPLLGPDDIVIDAGNSHWADTERRCQEADGRPWSFVGMGVSGGAEGALVGPSIMPGGDESAWRRLKPTLERIAAVSESGPCVAHCGRGSAGHFVKMVHNGIEYADMQLIAEVAVLLRAGMGLSATQVADTFASWNEGPLGSFLIEITSDIFRTSDPEKSDGSLLVDAILDAAGQKGTGRWTVMAAVELGVAVPSIAAAVDARVQSAAVELRARGQAAFPRTRAPLSDMTARAVEQALLAAKIAAYTQGFDLLAQASGQRDYGTDLAEMARIWTAGCIIRAQLLGRIRSAFSTDPDLPLLVLADDFRAEMDGAASSLRTVVSAATAAGFAVPGLAASLSWFDTLTTARGSASLIQAQRDYFGSHTYRRLDRPDVAVHTDWPRHRQR